MGRLRAGILPPGTIQGESPTPPPNAALDLPADSATGESALHPGKCDAGTVNEQYRHLLVTVPTALVPMTETRKGDK